MAVVACASMTAEPTLAEHQQGRMKWRGHETWYRVVGELDPGAAQTPVVICHGGPGAGHDYCEPIADLTTGSRGCRGRRPRGAQRRPDPRSRFASSDTE